jgi:hypothetical protein
MAKKQTQPPITDMPAPPKHHEMQQLARVEVVRGRTLRLMRSCLGNLRSLLSSIPGNEAAVERLRGESGDLILGRCSDFVMMELGDTASAIGERGLSRAMARKVAGQMGLSSEESGGNEAQTA